MYSGPSNFGMVKTLFIFMTFPSFPFCPVSSVGLTHVQSPCLKGSLWTKGHRNQSQRVDQDLLVESTMHGMVERQATWRVLLLMQTFSPSNFKTFDSMVATFLTSVIRRFFLCFDCLVAL